MKVFVTVEIEKGDDRKQVKHITSVCNDFQDTLRTNDIPTQLKITDLPRKVGFRKASELKDIET